MDYTQQAIGFEHFELIQRLKWHYGCFVFLLCASYQGFGTLVSIGRWYNLKPSAAPLLTIMTLTIRLKASMGQTETESLRMNVTKVSLHSMSQRKVIHALLNHKLMRKRKNVSLTWHYEKTSPLRKPCELKKTQNILVCNTVKWTQIHTQITTPGHIWVVRKTRQ